MFKVIQIRRAAARLTKAFPDITPEVARGRARRLLAEFHPLPTEFVADRLISGERLARIYEEAAGRR